MKPALLAAAILLLLGSCGNPVDLPELPERFPAQSTHPPGGPDGEQADLRPSRIGPLPPTTFLIVSDIHHLSPTLWSEGSAFNRFLSTDDGKVLRESTVILDALISLLLRRRPDFLVVTGDLTANGSAASHREVAAALAAIEATGVPVYVIPGNHDINNPWASSFHAGVEGRVEAVGAQQFASLYGEFGYLEASDRPGEGLSYSVSPLPGLRLLMLDTNRYDENRELGYPVSSGGLTPGELSWIRGSLQRSRSRGEGVLAFGHHNLVSHNLLGYRDEIRVMEESEANSGLLSSGGAPIFFSGHIHAQEATRSVSDAGEWVYDIVTGSISVYPHPYRVIEVTRDGSISLGGDALGPPEVTTAFLDSSREHFLQRTVSLLAPEIERTARVSRRTAERMSLYHGLLTIAQMAGEEGASEGLLGPYREPWELHAPGRLEELHLRLRADMEPPDNDIEIDPIEGLWRSLRR